MTQIQSLTQQIQNFSITRDWKQFHTFKDLAISLVLEATEVLEHFQWKSTDQTKEYAKTNKEDIAEELADVAIYAFQLSDDLGIDLAEAIKNKMDKNEKKYPVEKSKGNSKKYTKLD